MFKYLTSRKYRFFAKKVRSVQYSIWDFEFKIAKSSQVREGVRQDRDRAIEALMNMNKALATDPTNEKALADKAKAEDNIKRYEAQMKMVDDQIHGVPAEGENPGQEGIMDTLKSLAELREMYKSYLTQI